MLMGFSIRVLALARDLLTLRVDEQSAQPTFRRSIVLVFLSDLQ